jgi:hypothetical protein
MNTTTTATSTASSSSSCSYGLQYTFSLDQTFAPCPEYWIDPDTLSHHIQSDSTLQVELNQNAWSYYQSMKQTSIGKELIRQFQLNQIQISEPQQSIVELYQVLVVRKAF